MDLVCGEGRGCVARFRWQVFSKPLLVESDMRVWVTIVHPCRVKSFRKAVSAVMDDLELFNSVIEQLTPLPVANNLLIKLFQKCVCLVSTSSL